RLLSSSPSSTATSTASLHDALPTLADDPGAAHSARLSRRARGRAPRRAQPLETLLEGRRRHLSRMAARRSVAVRQRRRAAPLRRSEEHTSELQSRENLVCRLLLGKK